MQKKLAMKDLPESEKPYEKCLKYGPEQLSDAELVAVIIRTGSQNQQALDLARNVLAQSPGGILNLHYLTVEQLMKIHGIGMVKAIQLKCVAEISKRVTAATRQPAISMNEAQSIASFYMERLRHEEKEHLLLCMFDSKCNYITDETISVGTCNTSLISPREIFLKAIEKHAVYIVLLHNHPSGIPEPSEEDLSVTMRIDECGKLLEIPLLDHIIIGDNRYYSFHEDGIL